MLVLVLDTSLKGPLVGLADAKRGQILRFDVRQNPQDAVAQLPAIVAGILRQGSVGWDDIEGIIVGTGPGSFTGIKIGLSFVYGLHRARPKLRFYASSALESLARYSQQTFDLWALPATSNQGYYANRTNFGVLNLERGLQAEVLVTTNPKKLAVLGNWTCLEDLAKLGEMNLSILNPADLAFEVLGAMLQDYIANSGQLSDGLPRPLYLRKSAPEEKADRERMG